VKRDIAFILIFCVIVLSRAEDIVTVMVIGNRFNWDFCPAGPGFPSARLRNLFTVRAPQQ